MAWETNNVTTGAHQIFVLFVDVVYRLEVVRSQILIYDLIRDCKKRNNLKLLKKFTNSEQAGSAFQFPIEYTCTDITGCSRYPTNSISLICIRRER